MAKINDLTGRRFGKLTAQRIVSVRPKVWECLCDCGNIRNVIGCSLVTGNTRSCGCIKKEVMTGNQINRTHGMSKTKEWKAWASIKDRCLNPNVKGYENYGGRGITMHPAWINSFESFYEHIGDAPSKKHSVDRIDNSRGYEPGNVRWATVKEQGNNRRTNVVIEFQGKSLTIAQWSEELGVPEQLLYWRQKMGWTTERMLTRRSNRGWQEGDPGSPIKSRTSNPS